MKTAVLGLMIIVVIGVVIATRRTRAKSLRPSSLQTKISANPYHCVAIRQWGQACSAVKRLSGKRFLSKEAPRIPLMGCDAATCRCRYVHFEDRRQSDERRDTHPTVLAARRYSGPERRSGRERRRLVSDDMRAGAMGS